MSPAPAAARDSRGVSCLRRASRGASGATNSGASAASAAGHGDERARRVHCRRSAAAAAISAAATNLCGKHCAARHIKAHVEARSVAADGEAGARAHAATAAPRQCEGNEAPAGRGRGPKRHVAAHATNVAGARGERRGDRIKPELTRSGIHGISGLRDDEGASAARVNDKGGGVRSGGADGCGNGRVDNGQPAAGGAQERPGAADGDVRRGAGAGNNLLKFPGGDLDAAAANRRERGGERVADLLSDRDQHPRVAGKG